MLKLSDYIPALRYGAQIDMGQNSDLDASSYFSITAYMSHATASKPFLIDAYPNLQTAGVRGGALVVNLTRLSTYPLTSWDGNKDIAMKINAYNSAANGTNGGVEGLEILARNTGTGATNALVKGMACTAENKTGAGQVTSMLTAEFSLKNDGVVATSLYGVSILSESQGSNPTATAMLRFTTSTINPATGAIPAVINIAAKNSSGFTYLINAETDLIDAVVLGNSIHTFAGVFRILVAGTPYELPFYSIS